MARPLGGPSAGRGCPSLSQRTGGPTGARQRGCGGVPPQTARTQPQPRVAEGSLVLVGAGPLSCACGWRSGGIPSRLRVARPLIQRRCRRPRSWRNVTRPSHSKRSTISPSNETTVQQSHRRRTPLARRTARALIAICASPSCLPPLVVLLPHPPLVCSLGARSAAWSAADDSRARLPGAACRRRWVWRRCGASSPCRGARRRTARASWPPPPGAPAAAWTGPAGS